MSIRGTTSVRINNIFDRAEHLDENEFYLVSK